MWKYTGGPAGTGYVSGVPARDLTEDEWAEIPPELRKLARDQKLYEHAAPAKSEEKPAK